MFKSIIFILLFAGCASSDHTDGSDRAVTAQQKSISDGERAEIFSSFDYVNKQVWAVKPVPEDAVAYIKLVSRTPEGTKKENVLRFIKNMEISLCPLKGNFVLCGHIKSTFSFCDDARVKLDKRRYREHAGQEDRTMVLSKELGCN